MPSTNWRLDEPTSGLDSQTAWSICSLLRRLVDSGQTIVCTIHQPTAALLEMFDQLLLIDAGETLYFGPIGSQCEALRRYFERYGAPLCEKDSNPSEWMFQVTSRESAKNWVQIWKESSERRAIQDELMNLRQLKSHHKSGQAQLQAQYASPFWQQVKFLTYRTIIDCWRTPAYLWENWHSTS